MNGTFSPNVVAFNSNMNQIPPDLRSSFHGIASRIYPQDVISGLCESQYNPIVIGYIHVDYFPDFRAFQFPIRAQIQELTKGFSRPVKVGAEIVPEKLKWLIDFSKDDRECREKGEIHGEKVTSEQVQSLRSYRRVVNDHFSQGLVLSLLDQGFDVISLEHENVEEWIRHDEAHALVDGDGFFGSHWSEIRSVYTAIQRDIHGFRVIERERPDVIMVGLYHALKLDLLLNRDGSNSFYFPYDEVSWEKLISVWREVHALYEQQQPK